MTFILYRINVHHELRTFPAGSKPYSRENITEDFTLHMRRKFFISFVSGCGNRLHRALTTDIIAMSVHICRLILNRYRSCDTGLHTVLTPLFVKRCFCVTRRPVNRHCSKNCVFHLLGYDKKLSPYVAAD